LKEERTAEYVLVMEQLYFVSITASITYLYKLIFITQYQNIMTHPWNDDVSAGTGTTSSLMFVAAAVAIATSFLYNADAASRRFLGADELLARRTRRSRIRYDRMVDSLKKSEKVGKVLNDRDVEELVLNVMETTIEAAIILDIQQDSKDFELYLVLDCSKISKWGIVRVPLNLFCKLLSMQFERVVSSESMCFVADASAGLGPTLLTKCLQASTDVAILTPTWMIALAYLIEKNSVSNENIDKVVFALCRMEVKRVKDLKQITNSRTVVFNLPGQAAVPALLPVLQRVFPCERHLFVYDVCRMSVARSVALAKNTKEKSILQRPESMQTSLGSSMTKCLRNYAKELANLPETIANSVVSWMASVDIFLAMKDNEKENDYLPFVLRLGYLVGRTEGIGNSNVDLSDLCLANVLQFVTGSRSRSLPEHSFKAALDVLRSATKDHVRGIAADADLLSESDVISIEACVFCHKSILIGDKTLLDSVKPAKDWSLKAAKKLQSCACCAVPEDDDENPGPEDSILVSTSVEDSSPFNLQKSKINEYVDGKVMFAFDPTRFQ